MAKKCRYQNNQNINSVITGARATITASAICRETGRLGLRYFVINVARRYVEFTARKAISMYILLAFQCWSFFILIHRKKNLLFTRTEKETRRTNLAEEGHLNMTFLICPTLYWHISKYCFLVRPTQNKTWRTKLAVGGLVVVAVCGVEFCQLATGLLPA